MSTFNKVLLMIYGIGTAAIIGIGMYGTRKLVNSLEEPNVSESSNEESEEKEEG